MALSKIITNSLSDDAVTAAKIATGTIVAADLAANSVDSSELVDGGIDLSHMSVNSIDSDQYVDASIDTAHIGNLQVTTALIAADAIDGTKLADNAVDSEHYTDGSIDLAHMSVNSIDSDQYVDGSIDLAHMSVNSIDSDQYVDGSIDTAHLADNQITLAKMAGLARGKIIYGDASGDPAALTVGSDGQALVSNGTDISWGAAGLAWQAVATSAATVVAGRGYPVNTTSAAITMTLPSSASIGDEVHFIDYAGTFDTNNLTVARNSHKIQGATSDLVVATERAAFKLVYIDATQGWLLTEK